MFKKFISLEWKQFTRSANFKKNLAIKIFMGIGLFFFLIYAIGAGTGLFFVTKKVFPNSDPWELVNNFIIYWFIMELVFRYLIQKMPVIQIKPLLILPIKRTTVNHYGLGKSLITIFNFLPLFILVPYTIVLMFNGYNTLNVFVWFIGIYCISLTLSFVTLLINKSDPIFYAILIILLSLIGLEYFEILKISSFAGKGFNYFSQHPYLVIIPILTLVLSYYAGFKFMQKNLNLDNIGTNIKEVKTTDLSWLNRFGEVAPFLKNDIKLIWRNVRPKKTVISATVFLFYALYFILIKQSGGNSPVFLAFAMMFVTGGFAMTFGQFVPSWDSEYYKLLMSQNIRYKTYLDSKWYLMSFAVIVSFILATPYIYFGWKTYLLLIAGAFFNLGINSFLVLFGGVLNRTPLKLNEKAKAFGNTQGFKMVSMLIALPKIFLPMILFGIPYAIWGFNAGILTIIGFSSLGIILKNYFLTKIENIYQKTKYKTIAAYTQSE